MNREQPSAVKTIVVNIDGESNEEMSDDEAAETSRNDRTRNKRRSFSIKDKLAIVARIEAGEPMRRLSEEYGIDRRRLREWRDQREKLREIPNKAKRRKVLFHLLFLVVVVVVVVVLKWRSAKYRTD